MNPHNYSPQVTFDQDVRVNVFEANIRVLGGLLSGHMLAEKATSESRLTVKYKGELLDVAYAFGRRLLPAFDASPTGLPYAWCVLVVCCCGVFWYVVRFGVLLRHTLGRVQCTTIAFYNTIYNSKKIPPGST